MQTRDLFFVFLLCLGQSDKTVEFKTLSSKTQNGIKLWQCSRFNTFSLWRVQGLWLSSEMTKRVLIKTNSGLFISCLFFLLEINWMLRGKRSRCTWGQTWVGCRVSLHRLWLFSVVSNIRGWKKNKQKKTPRRGRSSRAEADLWLVMETVRKQQPAQRDLLARWSQQEGLWDFVWWIAQIEWQKNVCAHWTCRTKMRTDWTSEGCFFYRHVNFLFYFGEPMKQRGSNWLELLHSWKTR